jgi:hypothetical protein
MNKKIEFCLEKICQQGCCCVYKVITQLENGQIIDEIREFDLPEREKILLELKQIMTCYK